MRRGVALASTTNKARTTGMREFDVELLGGAMDVGTGATGKGDTGKGATGITATQDYSTFAASGTIATDITGSHPHDMCTDHGRLTLAFTAAHAARAAHKGVSKSMFG